MTKQEAQAAIRSGCRVRHMYFSPDEWIQRDSHGVVRTEDGCGVTNEFWAYRTGPEWDNDWEIITTA